MSTYHPARYFFLAAALLLASCGGGGGGGDNASAPATLPIVSLSLSPLTVVTGQMANIAWSASNATSCTADGAWSGNLATSGSQLTSQATAGSYRYSITCTGPGGNGSAQATLTVSSNATQAPPTVSISLTPPNAALGQVSTLAWSTTNATSCTASGAWSGVTATAGSLSVSQAAAGTYAYGLDCTGPAGNADSSATLTVTSVSNSLPVVLDGGVKSTSAFNTLFVSVKVCVPGTTTCQTIDHVLVDTGSSGLRLIKPGVLSSSLNLPIVTSSSGLSLGECAVFADGFSWGAVRRADIKLADEVALNTPIHLIGENPGGFAGIPSDCSGTGARKNTVTSMGANGILGIGLFPNDCDACLASVIPATYYSCSSTGCSGTKVTSSQIVMNPVAHFSRDNNGTVLVLPAIGNTGATNPAGALIFGIGTQANNTLGSATAYAANNSGRFSTSYKGKTISSFIDSGSNAIFFSDSTIRQCSVSLGFFCPTTPLTLTATNTASGGTTGSAVEFSLINVDTLATGVTAANAGGSAFSNGQFDWGIPFFFGRKVFTAIQGATTPAGQGPYWAY